MTAPAHDCCLAHWALRVLGEGSSAELLNPMSDSRVTYAADPEEHIWDRSEVDRYGEEVSGVELYSLRELFDAIYQDETEGYQALIGGVPVVI